MTPSTANTIKDQENAIPPRKRLARRFLPIAVGLLLALGGIATSRAADAEAATTCPLSIALRGNPSTGYSWLWTASGEGAVRESGVVSTPDRENLPGSPATFIHSFVGEKEGEVTLRFVYARFGRPGPDDPAHIYRLRVLPDKSIVLLETEFEAQAETQSADEE